MTLKQLERAKRFRDHYAGKVRKMHTDALGKYLVLKPADEPHDKRCQVTRMGPQSCCTCEINSTRRREAIQAAGCAADCVVLDGLGGMEQLTWHDARATVDPSHQNPYRSRR